MGGLEWGPSARRGHSVESELEKELGQIDGPGSHLGWGDVDNQEMLPCQLLVSVSITQSSIARASAALWLLSHNDTFTQCEPIQGRDGFDNLRKQTLEGEGRKQQGKRQSNASGSTSCSRPEPGQRNPLKEGHLPTCPPD